MRCPQCQSDNREGARFCLECGEKLELLCPQCGETLALSAKFCDECGHDLGKSEEVPSIDYSRPQTYTPKFLADKILTDRSSIEGERKLVTVLFADVVDYTSISEKLDAEEVHDIMDGCFRILMGEIHRYEGTIDKFTGDGLMALFGAPVAHEDHAQRACYAALGIQRAVKVYSVRIAKEYGVDFKMRVGLNSGPVIVGSIGNDLRMEYTAIGNTVNLASRMESTAEPGTIQVAEDTLRLTKEYFEFKPLGYVNVKGKKEPVKAYRVLGTSSVKDRLRAAMVRGLTRFVGRTGELRHLADCFAQVKGGCGQVVGIVGEAGVGKSRLLLEWKETLSGEEHTFLEGSCLHHADAIAYLPILNLLRSYFDIREGEQESLIKQKIKEKITQLDEKLKDILPPLHEILSLKVEDEEHLTLEPPQKREKAFEAIRNLLIRESQSKPLILAVEDLHWIDRTSEEFLNYLMGWLANTQILLLLLYRPEYSHSWGGKSFYSQIGVNQLSTAASTELLQAILEGGEVAPELRELVLSKTGGNPLFTEEFTRTLLESGSIQREYGHYVLSMKTSDIRVPDTIQGIIAARMDRLEESLRQTLQVASVIGRDFAFRILHTITGMQEELKSYLLELQELEFVYEKSLFPELEYMFKHALTQEVAYNSLLIRKRKNIHERIGEAIEELYPNRLEEFYEMLAHHYSRSENSEKSYQYLKLSGNKAKASDSNWEAFHFYREAVNLLKKLPETEKNKRRGIEIRLQMEGPMVSLAHPEDSFEILREGERLATELVDEKSLAAFYNVLRGYYSVRGQPLQGMKYAENSFRAAMKVQDIELAVSMGFGLCVSYGTMGEHLKIAEVAPQILALLEKTQRESEFFVRPWNVYSALLALYGIATGWTKDFEEGRVLCEKGLHFALQIDDLGSAGFAEVMYGVLLVGQGDAENAIKHAQNGVKLCEEGQILVILGTGLAMLAEAHRLLGELGPAQKHAERALKVGSDSGLSIAWAQSYYSLSMTHLYSGDLENARTCAEEALRLARSNNEIWVEGRARVALGRILGRSDLSQTDKAEEYILQGIKILDELQLKPFCAEGYLYLGELYADSGQGDKVLGNVRRAEAMFQEMGMDYWLRRTQGILDRLQS